MCMSPLQNICFGQLVAWESTGKNSLDSREFGMSALGESHVVELGALNVANFVPKVAPVHVSMLGLFMEKSSVRQRKREDVAVGLFTNDGNVPLG